MQFPKDKIYRSEEYKAYVRTLPCIVCGGNAEPHHEIGGGMGIKGPDLFCIPLCRGCHQERHSKGVLTFWNDYYLITPMGRWQAIAETLAKVWEMKHGNP